LAVGILCQDAKPLTTGAPLASLLLHEKSVQLVVGRGKFPGCFRTCQEASAMAGHCQFFNLTAFVLGPQGAELRDMVLGQGVATAHVVDDPGSRTDKTTAKHSQERGWTQVNRHAP